MDLELLRTFLEVSYTRHFGRAGRELHLTQAAVSARIKHLESILGVSLFDRSRRGVRLTAEGERLVRHADVLISAWRKARQEVSRGSDHQISVGGSLRLWDILLQDWLARLRRWEPDLAVTAESRTPEMLTRRLLDGVLDIAVMLEPAQLEVLRIREVALIDLVLVSTRAGLSATQALERDYLFVDWGLGHALQHRRAFPDAPEPDVRVSQAKMALAYMRDLGGSAYLPTRFVATEIESGVLHRVADAPVMRHHAYAVYALRTAKAELIDRVLSFLPYAPPEPGLLSPDVMPTPDTGDRRQ